MSEEETLKEELYTSKKESVKERINSWLQLIITAASVVSILLFSIYFFKDSPYLVGKITDRNTREPIDSVWVNCDRCESGVYSDINGRFEIEVNKSPLKRDVKLSFTHKNYYEDTLRERIGYETEKIEEIKMRPKLVEKTPDKPEEIEGEGDSSIGKPQPVDVELTKGKGIDTVDTTMVSPPVLKEESKLKIFINSNELKENENTMLYEKYKVCFPEAKFININLDTVLNTAGERGAAPKIDMRSGSVEIISGKDRPIDNITLPGVSHKSLTPKELMDFLRKSICN